jgi:hypothetical protein
MAIEKTGLLGKISLDLWAVATALVLALLVRLNVIPTVKW